MPGRYDRPAVDELLPGIAARLRQVRLEYRPDGRREPFPMRAWRQVLEAAGWSITYATLQGYETGAADPPATFVATVCDISGTHPRWLLRGDGSRYFRRVAPAAGREEQALDVLLDGVPAEEREEARQQLLNALAGVLGRGGRDLPAWLRESLPTEAG